MNNKRLHYTSGLTLLVFITLHLFNHFIAVFGIEKHLLVMNSLRLLYRNTIIEAILLIAVCTQIASGLKLSFKQRTLNTSFEKLHVWSGLYLAIFLVIHVTAIFIGRLYLHLDTNFYFGVAGLNSFPLNLFFIPYYGLAIITIFGHLSAVHNSKMKHRIFGLTPHMQAIIILVFGMALTLVIFYGLTNKFNGVIIPPEYNILKAGS